MDIYKPFELVYNKNTKRKHVFRGTHIYKNQQIP